MINIDELTNTFIEDKHKEEKTYTRAEGYEMGQQFIREQQEGAIAEATEALTQAKIAYLEAIKAYKSVFDEANTKIARLERAINDCYYQEFPVVIGRLVPNNDLMEVGHRHIASLDEHLEKLRGN